MCHGQDHSPLGDQEEYFLHRFGQSQHPRHYAHNALRAAFLAPNLVTSESHLIWPASRFASCKAQQKLIYHFQGRTTGRTCGV